MRTERFRQILEILGSIDPNRFASEKQHIEKRERRFVGFIKPSTGALFAFSGQNISESLKAHIPSATTVGW